MCKNDFFLPASLTDAVYLTLLPADRENTGQLIAIFLFLRAGGVWE